MAKIDDIIENFDLLDDWEDRYKYLIELGKDLEPLDEAQKNSCTKVTGCASQVWLVTSHDNNVLKFKGDSDAHIVKGLIAILIALYSKQSADYILSTDAKTVFQKLNLEDHLTQQRANGLSAMIARIKQHAANIAEPF